jgi:hypothetical protein
MKALICAMMLGGCLVLVQPVWMTPGGGAAHAQAATSLDDATQPAEDPSVLPAGTGQEEVFYACTACHSTAIVRRSRFTREQWDNLMTWMTEVHNMNPLEGEDRKLIVDYLAQHFGPQQGQGRATNPFLK